MEITGAGFTRWRLRAEGIPDAGCPTAQTAGAQFSGGGLYVLGNHFRLRTPRITRPAVMTFHLKPAPPPTPVHTIIRQERPGWLAFYRYGVAKTNGAKLLVFYEFPIEKRDPSRDGAAIEAMSAEH